MEAVLAPVLLQLCKPLQVTTVLRISGSVGKDMADVGSCPATRNVLLWLCPGTTWTSLGTERVGSFLVVSPPSSCLLVGCLWLLWWVGLLLCSLYLDVPSSHDLGFVLDVLVPKALCSLLIQASFRALGLWEQDILHQEQCL